MVSLTELKEKFGVCISALIIGGGVMLHPVYVVAKEVQPTIDNALADYQREGAVAFSYQRGEELWTTQVTGPEPFSSRSCVSCHGTGLKASGQHVQTKKVIAPMSPAANTLRYQNRADIDKWFLRNCKWTFGRVCSAQERGDLLTYLRAQ